MGKNTSTRAKPPAEAKDPRQGSEEAAKAAAAAASQPPAEPAAKRKRAALEDDTVSMSVHRAFNLTDDLGIQHRYEVGIQDMPRHHAEHFYTKHHADSNEE